MLNRNKNPLYPPTGNHLKSPKQTFQPILRHQVQSPPALFHRYQRNSKDEPMKSSSLNNRLKIKSFQGQVQQNTKQNRGVAFDKSQHEIMEDYFPVQQVKNLATFSRNNNHKAEQINKTKRQRIVMCVNSSPNLLNLHTETSLQENDRRDQESVSTQQSKQASIKQVKFGGIVDQTQKDAFKKRQKVRSPSILKNGSRNILNNSFMSAQRERSCSVASTRDRRQREKRGNETCINMMIKQKFKSILSKLQSEHQVGSNRGNRFSGATYNIQKPVIHSPFKYKDDIFPPVYSSLFCLKKGRAKVGEQIRWMRITSLFKSKELVLAQLAQTNIQIFKSLEGYCQQYFPAALNCLLGCPKVIEKMFQKQTINPYGIYLVKIYQESVWKYIIVDDYIPVIKNKQGVFQPAFVNVRTISEGPIDIWPFLVQKAYANYYSSYEALQHGNTIDMLEELTGTASQMIMLVSQSKRKKDKMTAQQMQSNLNRSIKFIKTGESVVLGQICGQKGYAPIVYDCEKQSMYWNDPFCQFKRRRLNAEIIKETFKALNFIFPFKMTCNSATALRKTRPIVSQDTHSFAFQPQLPSIRTFKIIQSGEYSLSLRQRDRRFYHFKQNYGQYIWCRVILLQKQYQDCGFRWIDGCYSQKKTISFINLLEPGEYWLLIQPQWNKSSANELMINVSGPTQVEFRRELYRQQDKIMQKGCLDLAQRYGELNQINKFICSYNYITQKVGLIIENIINQRVSGSVSVMRSIRGLKCKSQILPVNSEFYQAVSTVNGQKLYKLNEEIELQIAHGDHFTVVLKLKGGMDYKFFRTFDFGC